MLQDSGIFEMLGLAQELGVEELWRSCEEHVSSTLSPGNACALLTAALEAQDRVPGKNFYKKWCTRKFYSLRTSSSRVIVLLDLFDTINQY